MDDLLPCPFCGGGASVQSWSWPYPRWRVVCSCCKSHASGRRADPSDAIAAWNTRATPPAPGGGDVERVAVASDDIKRLWKKHGGDQHGPHIEQYYIEEQAFYKFARELIALSAMSPAGEWQPIDTAPLGVHVDLWIRCGLTPEFRADLRLAQEYRLADCIRSDEGWIAPDGDRVLPELILFWRHVPAPPAKASGDV